MKLKRIATKPSRLHFVIVVLIVLNVIFIIALIGYVVYRHLNKKEKYVDVNNTLTYERVTFFFKDTIKVNSIDPYFQYSARQQLIDNFSIKTRAEIHVCLSDACTDTFTVPKDATYTNGILTDHSTFMFVLRNTDNEQASLTEYFILAPTTPQAPPVVPAPLAPYVLPPPSLPLPPTIPPIASKKFSTISFQVTVTAAIPLNTQLTLSTIKNIIRNGTCKVWFDENQYGRDTFQLERGLTTPAISVPFQFVSWSTNMTDPEIQCLASECDAFRIVPRNVTV